MDYQDFSSQYQVLEIGYAKKFGIENNVCLVIPTYEQEKQKSNLVAIRISKGYDEKVLLKYRTLKFLTILQPEQYFQTQDEHCLIYENLYEHLFTQEKLSNMTQEQGYKFLLQIVLTFLELQRRQIFWALKSINQIYYIQGIIYLSLLEFDFNYFNQQFDYLQCFWFFFDQYFSYRFYDVAQLKSKSSLDEILQELFIKNGNIHLQSMLNPHYEKVLQYLLNINVFQLIYNGNCVVKQFKRNGLFSIYPNLTEDIVYKSTEIKGNEESKQQIIKQIQRDIELMEQFSNKDNVASCFAYLRIKEYAFILYKKFTGTLADRFKNWPQQQQTIDSIKKDVYVTASRTADSLRILHEKKILHRDLKPENIFLDNENMSEAFSYVADFDCSKQIQDESDVYATRADCFFTPKYDPPEIFLTFKYDIFQFGLIIYTLANKGKYIGLNSPRNLKDNEFDSFYSKEAVIKNLSPLNYDSRFIDIVAQCLLKDPQERPDIKTVCSLLSKLKAEKKIKITQNSPFGNQDEINNEQQHTLQRRSTLDSYSGGNSPNLFGLAQKNNEDFSPTKPKIRILSNETASSKNLTNLQSQYQNCPGQNLIPFQQPQQVTQAQQSTQPNYQQQFNSQNQGQINFVSQQQNFNQNYNFNNVAQPQQNGFIPQQQEYQTNNQQQWANYQQSSSYSQQQQQSGFQYQLPYNPQQQQIFQQQFQQQPNNQQQFQQQPNYQQQFQQQPNYQQQFQQQQNNQQQFQQQPNFQQQFQQQPNNQSQFQEQNQINQQLPPKLTQTFSTKNIKIIGYTQT